MFKVLLNFSRLFYFVGLKLRATIFVHFFYAVLKEVSSFENISDDVYFGIKIKFLFLVLISK